MNLFFWSFQVVPGCYFYSKPILAFYNMLQFVLFLQTRFFLFKRMFWLANPLKMNLMFDFMTKWSKCYYNDRQFFCITKKEKLYCKVGQLQQLLQSRAVQFTCWQTIYPSEFLRSWTFVTIIRKKKSHPYQRRTWVTCKLEKQSH